MNFPSLEEIVVMLPGIIMAIAFHEYAHARVAAWFGDPTPRLQGRVTIDPRSHIDIVGLLCFLFLGFGWGRPVLTNPSKYRNPVLGDIAVSLAGVTMNFVLAVLSLLAVIILARQPSVFYSEALMRTLQFAAQLNVILIAFNLIPLPPLDGWHVVRRLLPQRMYEWTYHVERWGFVVLAVLFLSPVGRFVFQPMYSAALTVVHATVGFIVRPLVAGL